MAVTRSSPWRLYDGTYVPLTGSDGVEITKVNAIIVYTSLLELEKEGDPPKGTVSQEAFEALHILYKACIYLKERNLNIQDAYFMEESPGLNLLRRHKFVVGSEITTKLLLVSNCLWQSSKEYHPQKKIYVLYPFRASIPSGRQSR
jgi:hypothetical protein